MPGIRKKTVEHESVIIPIIVGAPSTVTKRSSQGLEDLKISKRVETF